MTTAIEVYMLLETTQRAKKDYNAKPQKNLLIFHETMFNLSQVLDKPLISIYGNQHRKIGAYYHI